MSKIKKIFSLIITIIVIYAIYINKDKIYKEINTFFNNNREIIIKPQNQYTKNYNFYFVKQTNEFVPHSQTDLKNIFYSFLNNGWEEFTFYCPEEYKTCLNDIETISNNTKLISEINDFVHPFNSYKSFKTIYDSSGMVKISIEHIYSNDEIKYIEEITNKIINDKINDTMNNQEKIKVLHDYIINNTKYDIDKSNNLDSPYDSTRILGILNDHYAVCSGYADLMAVFLSKLGFDNYKVSNDKHVWNAVLIDNKWLHLDLTWDDPVSNNGEDILLYDYFLINTKKLLTNDTTEHTFDKNVFKELTNK